MCLHCLLWQTQVLAGPMFNGGIVAKPFSEELHIWFHYCLLSQVSGFLKNGHTENSASIRFNKSGFCHSYNHSWSQCSFWRNRTIVKTRTAILARKHFSWSVNCYVSGSPFKILFYNRSSRVLLIFYFLIRTSICQTNLSLRILGFVCTISRFHDENIFVGLVGLGQYSTTQKSNGAWKYLEYFI